MMISFALVTSVEMYLLAKSSIAGARILTSNEVTFVPTFKIGIGSGLTNGFSVRSELLEKLERNSLKMQPGMPNV